jgi:hypothetical protein
MKKKKSDRVRDMLEDLAIWIIMLFWLTIIAETAAYFIVNKSDLFL